MELVTRQIVDIRLARDCRPRPYNYHTCVLVHVHTHKRQMLLPIVLVHPAACSNEGTPDIRILLYHFVARSASHIAPQRATAAYCCLACWGYEVPVLDRDSTAMLRSSKSKCDPTRYHKSQHERRCPVNHQAQMPHALCMTVTHSSCPQLPTNQ